MRTCVSGDAYVCNMYVHVREEGRGGKLGIGKGGSMRGNQLDERGEGREKKER